MKNNKNNTHWFDKYGWHIGNSMFSSFNRVVKVFLIVWTLFMLALVVLYS